MSQESTPMTSDSERNSDNNFEEIPNPEDASLQDNIVNIDDFDNNLPETVTLLRGNNGAKIYLVGTAHFSIESQNDVTKVIRTVQPNVVIVELCSSRINILQYDEKALLEEATNLDFKKVMTIVKQNGFIDGLMYILLLSSTAEMAKQLGMGPGGEFRTAFVEAKKLNNCDIYFGDRPLQITIQRVLSKLSWFQMIKFGWTLITSKEVISKEEVEKSKRPDMLEEMLAGMTGTFPALGEVLVHERDIFLTHYLQATSDVRLENGQLRYPKMVAVVGMGHIPGIVKLWPNRQAPFIPEIMIIPPPTMCSKIIKVTFKLSLITLGGFLVYRYVPGAKNVPSYCKSLCNNISKFIK